MNWWDEIKEILIVAFGFSIFILVGFLFLAMLFFADKCFGYIPPSDPNITDWFLSADPNERAEYMAWYREWEQAQLDPTDPNMVALNDWIQAHWPIKHQVYQFDHVQTTGTLFWPPFLSKNKEPEVGPNGRFIYTVDWMPDGKHHKWAWIYQRMDSGMPGWNDYTKTWKWTGDVK